MSEASCPNFEPRAHARLTGLTRQRHAHCKFTTYRHRFALPGVAAHSMIIEICRPCGAAASLPRRALRARHGARQSLASFARVADPRPRVTWHLLPVKPASMRAFYSYCARPTAYGTRGGQCKGVLSEFPAARICAFYNWFDKPAPRAKLIKELWTRIARQLAQGNICKLIMPN